MQNIIILDHYYSHMSGDLHIYEDDMVLRLIPVILKFSMLSLAWTILSMLNMGGLLPHMMQFLAIFSFVFIQVSPQTACNSAYIVTLISFVWLFSAVCFQMCPQMVCIRGRIITLVTFVWLFPTVCFQMCSQMVCTRGCIITLVAFFRLFPTVCFQMCSQMACMRGHILTVVALVWFLSLASSCHSHRGFNIDIVFSPIMIWIHHNK